MKNIKLLFIALLVFVLGATSVNALEPHPENGSVIVDGVVLYEKGALTGNSYYGAYFDLTTMTLTINGGFSATQKKGIEIIEMGDYFTILVDDDDVKIEVEDRYDGIYILNSEVTLKTTARGYIKVINNGKGKGIFVDGTSKLHVNGVGLEVGTVEYNQGSVEVWEDTAIVETKFIKNNQEVELIDVTVPKVVEEIVIDARDNQETVIGSKDSQRKDSLKDIAVYAVIAGLLIVGGITVLLITIKNQKDIKK